jgi:hypothetical protein
MAKTAATREKSFERERNIFDLEGVWRIEETSRLVR